MLSAAALMKEWNSVRDLYLFDLFGKAPGPKGYKKISKNFLATSVEKVADSFRARGLLDSFVHFEKGLFQDTLPKWDKGNKIAVLRVDGNFYDSYQDAMYYMYESVSLGGYVIFDDVYSHSSVMRFWKDFKSEQGLNEELVRTDLGSAWFQKRKTVKLDWSFFRAPQDINRKKGEGTYRCPAHIEKCHSSWGLV